MPGSCLHYIYVKKVVAGIKFNGVILKSLQSKFNKPSSIVNQSAIQKINNELLIDLIFLSARQDGFRDSVDAISVISEKNIAAIPVLVRLQN